MGRFVAIVLPDLPSELVRQREPVPGPLGVLVELTQNGAEDGAPQGSEGPSVPRSTDVLDAVDEAARRFGIRPRQRVTEATTLHASLSLRRVSMAAIRAALDRIADAARAFGTTVAITLDGPEGARDEAAPWVDAPLDTLWVDVTGAAHLLGGETNLVHELEAAVRSLGHRARVALASGPRIAQAVARFGAEGGPVVVAEGRESEALAPLPVHALPLDSRTTSYLVRLGLFALGHLAALPRTELAARLGPRAELVLGLLAGHDDRPLVALPPPTLVAEEVELEDGVESSEALLFVLRGMTSRLAARLALRGQATTKLAVTLTYDHSIAALRWADARGADHARNHETASPCPTHLGWTAELPRALAREADLLRVLRARLEKTTLLAPARRVRLDASEVVSAPRFQLDLSRSTGIDPDRLPTLVAELVAELGPHRVGLLATRDSHVPEDVCHLVQSLELKPSERMTEPPPWAPSRLLPTPVPLGRLTRTPRSGGGPGEPELLVVGPGLPFTARNIRFVLRLDGIGWWTPTAVARDYFHAWLGGTKNTENAAAAGEAAGRALFFVDRRTGEAFLHGWDE
jgi:protein ImuB